MKTCGCGNHYEEVPSFAKYSPDPWLGGYYWECVCGSTLFVPDRKDAK